MSVSSRRALLRAGVALIGVTAMGTFAPSARAQTTQTPSRVAFLLGRAAEFITVQHTNIQSFDEGAARKVLDASDVHFVRRVVHVNNSIVARRAVLSRQIFDGEVETSLRGFYRAMANDDSGVFSELARGKREGQSSVGGPVIASHCSGPSSNPAPCPWAYYRADELWPSKIECINWLVNVAGYHQTADYASNYHPADFTRITTSPNYPSCDRGGAFRDQATVSDAPDSYGYWYYRYQSPEPNPEIQSYWWPETWWGDYVRWWHLSHC